MFKIVFVILWMQAGNELTFTLEREFTTEFECKAHIAVATDLVNRASRPGYFYVKEATCKRQPEQRT